MLRSILATSMSLALLLSLLPVARSADDGWVDLLADGKLDQWKIYGAATDAPVTGWVVKDGCLTVEGEAGDLMTRGTYENFELEFEWKVPESGNSGVMYRVVETDGPPYMSGPEYQVLDNAGHKLPATEVHAAGSLYEIYPCTVDAAKPAGEWNSGRIVVRDGQVEHWLNGQKVLECQLGSHDWNAKVKASKFADSADFGTHERGHLDLQYHGNPVWYRNLRVRELSTAAAATDRPARMLFVTQSQGFRHSTVTRKPHGLSHTEQVMTEMGIRSGLFRVDCTQDVETDFKPELIKNYDVVAFYTTGQLPIDTKVMEWFLNTWLKEEGHAFLGVHAAADTYADYEPYWDMVGGTFDGHPWGADSIVTITVHDPTHPAAKPWGQEFTIRDEIYQFKNWQPEKVRVLMSLNMAKTDLKKPYHVPVCWVKPYGNGRVMHMSMGHREDVWTNPTYQASLEGGIAWLLKRVDGDATPNPELSSEQDAKAKQDAKCATARRLFGRAA